MKQKLNGNIIIFDWGNTLVLDPFDIILPEVCLKAAKLAKDMFRIEIDALSFSKAWSKVNNEVQFQYASHFSQEEPFIQQALELISVPADIRMLLTPQILSIYRFAFKSLLKSDMRKTEVNAVLKKLKERNKKMGILTNDRKFTARATLTWMDAYSYIDKFFSAEEIGYEKPDPQVFDVISERFNSPLSDIIYIGDDPIRDIKCAHDAHVKAVLYVPPKQYRTSKSWRNYAAISDIPEATVKIFKDILNVIS